MRAAACVGDITPRREEWTGTYKRNFFFRCARSTRGTSSTFLTPLGDSAAGTEPYYKEAALRQDSNAVPFVSEMNVTTAESHIWKCLLLFLFFVSAHDLCRTISGFICPSSVLAPIHRFFQYIKYSLTRIFPPPPYPLLDLYIFYFI